MGVIDRFLTGLDALLEEPADAEFVTIALPGDLDPHERHYRFTMHIDAELRFARLGSAGGGSAISALDDDDEWRTAFSLIDADTTDLERGRALMRHELAELGAPPGTLIQYDDQEDRWDGEAWHLGEDRSFDEDLLDGFDE
jgi:hypothetical protein